MTVPGLLLILISAGAVWMDWMRERVSNEWIVMSWISGLFLHLYESGLMGIGQFFGGAIFPIVLLFLLFYFRMLGAGDIKLLSALGGIAGISAIGRIILWSFFTGAALALAILLLCGNLIPRLMYFTNYFTQLWKTKKYRPYYKKGKQLENFHFTVPILISVLLYAGGII